MKGQAGVLALLLVLALPCNVSAREEGGGKPTVGAPQQRRGEASRLAERLKTAKIADAATQYALGLDYRNGHGVPQDAAQAYKWIHLAAVNNLAEAQFTIGQMDAAGEGAPRHSNDAADWFRKAAKQGHLGATLALAGMYRKGEGMLVDFTQAARYYRIAADRDDIQSQLTLGEFYLRGEGVTMSADDAAVWFRRAAQLGSAEARYRLALLLLDGDPATQGWADVLQTHVPGAAGRSHITIAHAGHFLQEDCGPRLADVVADFVEATPPA